MKLVKSNLPKHFKFKFFHKGKRGMECRIFNTRKFKVYSGYSKCDKQDVYRQDLAEHISLGYAMKHAGLRSYSSNG